MRILIYTGKGGVGKTSIATATAYFLAKTGKKVLLMSTDQAHSLQDSLECKLSNEPFEVYKNLFAVEIDSVEESRKNWGNLQGYLKQIITEKANDGIEADEALLFPGLDEVFALLRILEIYKEKKYDVLVIDCAPTGQSLSLLTYAEKLQMIADKILPMVKNINSAFGSFISKRTSVPKPRDIVFDEFSSLVKKLNVLQDILREEQTTTVRIVTTPEKIVIDEARRNYTWLLLYGFNVDAVYINKIYPKDILDNDYFSPIKEIQNKNIEFVEKSFLNQKIFKLELQDEEVFGKKALEKISENLYKELNPFDVFSKIQNFKIEDIDGTRILIIPLPFAKKEEIFVTKEETDIVISYLNETRRFHLPDKLCRRKISKYIYEDGNLKINMDYE